MHVCTVISKSRVAHARALARSLREHQPDATLAVLIVDPWDGFVEPADEPFEILTPSDLQIPYFEELSARYEAFELCTGLKPWLIGAMLDRHGECLYMDSDVLVLGPIAPLAETLGDGAVALTPHLLRELPQDGREPSELAILRAGSFNAGIIAARDAAGSSALLDWWCERLRRGSRLDAARGLVLDQRWLDLMPGLFDCVRIWRDPGMNFGYWRAPDASIEHTAGGFTVDGSPLRCFHMTGFDSSEPQALSRYQNRDGVSEDPALLQIMTAYAALLADCGERESDAWPYAFASTASGAAMTAELRAMWDRAYSSGAVLGTPFTPAGESELLDWLAEGEGGPGGGRLPRVLAELHRIRPELAERFPHPRGVSRDAYLAWASERAEREPGEVLGMLAARERSGRRPGLRDITVGESIGALREQVVVCIPVYGAREMFAECIVSVLAHTPKDVRILIADDASPDPAIGEFVNSLEPVLEHELIYLRQPENLGFPGNVNAAFDACAPADVVILNSDCVVAAGWLEGMRRAACSDGMVATASSLTNHGTIVSVPERNRPSAGLPQSVSLDHAAAAVRAQGGRLYPRLPTAVGHCVYVRRHALELVGGFDMSFSPGYGEEVDFSQRCLLHGLLHVAADDVLVLHHAGASFSQDGRANPVQERHELIIQSRYPYYERATAAAARAEFGRLPRAIGTARRAIKGLTVTIDGRCLGPFVTGTQVHTIQLIRALDATGQVTLRVIVPPDLGSYAQLELSRCSHVDLMAHDQVRPGIEPSDISHRPYQVSGPSDLELLRLTGERIVITQQDLIAYRNPGYFAGYPQWERFQRLTRRALALAAEVVFFSHHAAQDTFADDLVEPSRASVVYIGVDHSSAPDVTAAAPGDAASLSERPFLLCLGTDFRHKNRLFAIRVLEALAAEHEWDGALVLAGPRVSVGSSAGDEAAYLATRPQLAARVITLPAVSEAEKLWLLDACTAVMYPSTYEGFGLMPFEAADHERPCLFASQTALGELLPSELATLTPWDPLDSARRVHALISSEVAREAHVNGIREAAAPLTWKSAAENLLHVYRRAAAAPAREATVLLDELNAIDAEREEAERKYAELWESLTPDARALIAPDGPLTDGARHALAAMARRPLLRSLLVGQASVAQRAAHVVRGETPPQDPPTPPEAFALHFGFSNIEHMRQRSIAERETPPEPQP